MTRSMFLRAAASSITLIALSACTTPSVVTEGPEANARPVTASELLASAAGVTPDGRVELLDSRDRGFILNTDNTITYVDLRATREWLRTTKVVSSSGNQICMDRLDAWSGACLTIYRMNDGSISTQYKFGNGHGGVINSTPFYP